MTKRYNDVFLHAIKKYGKEAQLVVAIEEMSELIKEICKDFRGSCNDDAIAEEMADVYIMLAQMQIMFCNEEDVREWIKKKVERLSMIV